MDFRSTPPDGLHEAMQAFDFLVQALGEGEPWLAARFVAKESAWNSSYPVL